jgi:hypothetical protein
VEPIDNANGGAPLRSSWELAPHAAPPARLRPPARLTPAAPSAPTADLKTLGGLEPLVRLLQEGSPAVQAAAAYVLGTAASNNDKFQGQLLEAHPEVLAHLLQVGRPPLAHLAPPPVPAPGP